MKKILLAIAFLLAFATQLPGDTCVGPGSQEGDLNLCLPACGSTNWCEDMNDNLSGLGGLFNTTTGHTHTGAGTNGPNLPASSVTGDLVIGQSTSTQNGVAFFDDTSGQSIDASTVTLTTAGLMSFPDGSFVTLGAIDMATTNEGFALPQAASCSNAALEGVMCWDTDDDSLWVGDGAAAVEIGGGGGGGDVSGPASATDLAITRFDGTGGKLLQDSDTTLSDLGVLTSVDGGGIDMSAIDYSDTSEGLILPQAASCANGIAEGKVCWDSDDDILNVGIGASLARIAKGAASSTINAIPRFNSTAGVQLADSGCTATGGSAICGSMQVDTLFLFEGATPDANETIFSATDPTASNIITLPDDSGTLCLAGDGSNDCTAADGDLIDFSAVNVSGAAEGILLPQTTSCVNGTGEGQVCWDTDDDVFTIGTGAAAKTIGGGNVSGPVSSTDNAIVAWDGAGGDTLQDTSVTLAAGLMSFPDGGFLTLAAIDMSTSAEGFFLPQAASCANSVLEGGLCWDTDDDILYVGDAAAPVGVLMSIGSSTNNAIATWDLATGGVLQEDSACTSVSGTLTCVSYLLDTTLGFEGSTDDGNDTFIQATDPTGTNIQTLPDATGTFCLTGNGDNTCLAADGDLINFSTVNVSGTAEGILLPQHTSCASGTAEGQICWDSDNDALYVGDGAAAQVIASSVGTTNDNAIVRWDGTAGQALQNSTVLVDDSDNITGAVTIEVGQSFSGNGTIEINHETQATLELNTFDASFGSVINLTRAQGTAASPTATQSGDLLGSYNACGYGTSFTCGVAGAGFLMFASETWDGSNQGSDMTLYTTANTTAALTQWVKLTNAGVLDLDFNAATRLKLPQATSSSETAEGSIFWDTDDNYLTVGDSSNALPILSGPSGGVTDNTIVRFNGATGGVTQASSASIDDNGGLHLKDLTTDLGVDLQIMDDEQITYTGVAHGTGNFTEDLLVAARGTVASPTATQSGDILGRTSFCGYTDTYDCVFPTAHIAGLATENYTGSANGGKIRFTTTANGATSGTTRLEIDQDGSVNFDVDSSTTLILPAGATISDTTEASIGWDSDGDVLQVGDGAAVISIGGKVTKSIPIPIGGVSTDATQCADPTEKTINSGPKVWAMNCADNAGSIFYWNINMPDSYGGGTITVEMQAMNENATPSGNLDFDISCMCRGDSDAINSTWGTAVNIVTAFDTQYDEEHQTSAAITPNGTCTGGPTLYCRGVMDATGTTTEVADTYILGVKVEYVLADGTD